ncbi:MAG: tRNA uridine-5-carboxymethylaminomethyl(34) synthesis GTPase MnmE, partial [Armatimonadota bacterium]
MNVPDPTDTIAAISTPLGEGGIGIVRISGDRALEIAAHIFRPLNPAKRVAELPTHTVHHGHVLDGSEIVDEALLTLMRAPRSYTRQDVAELSCHGGVVPLRRTLQAALNHGARLAEPGEFTRRAFINGRIDLAQAEAVADLIYAKTEESHRAAMAQLRGCLSREVRDIREELLDLITYVEASIDFVDEDITFLTLDEQRQRCESIRQRLQSLIASADSGQVLREGLATAIIGRPNVGKSSLMNALLRRDRVIVTPIPGTTRDVVQDLLNIKGIPVRLADTAGLRDAHDLVESEGVQRSRREMQAADLVLLVVDASAPLTEADRRLLREARADRTIVVINKIDLPQVVTTTHVREVLPDVPCVEVSATQRLGLEGLEEAIAQMVWRGRAGPSDAVIVTNVRHRDAL